MVLRGHTWNINFEVTAARHRLKDFCFSGMEFLPQECAANSAGMANGLFGLLIQTIIAAQCGLAPDDRWPKDYGPTAVENGF